MDALRGLRLALRDMLALLVLTAAFWLVHVFGRTLPGGALAAVWVGLSVLIAAGGFRRARIRRAAFLSAYIRRGSPLERRLRGGWPMALRQLVLAAALALVLLVALIRLRDPAVWAVLIAAVALLVPVRRLSKRALAGHVSRDYVAELAWRVTLAVVGAVLVAALVLLAWHRPQAELGGVSLEQAVWHFVDGERARSDGLSILLQMAAAKDALRLWIAQQLMPEPGTSLAQAAGWLVVLAEETVFVWSYLLSCSAVLIGLNADERGGEREL